MSNEAIEYLQKKWDEYLAVQLLEILGERE